MCYSTLRWRRHINKMSCCWTPKSNFLTWFSHTKFFVQVKSRTVSVLNPTECTSLYNNAYVIIDTDKKKTLRQYAYVPTVTDIGFVPPLFAFIYHVSLKRVFYDRHLTCCFQLLCWNASITLRQLCVTFDHYLSQNFYRITQSNNFLKWNWFALRMFSQR